jgi:hypothetical protein
MSFFPSFHSFPSGPRITILIIKKDDAGTRLHKSSSCNELNQKKNEITRFAVCPHCQTGSVRQLDRDHNATSDNWWSSTQTMAKTFSRSKSSQECRPEFGTMVTGQPFGSSSIVGFSYATRGS